MCKKFKSDTEQALLDEASQELLTGIQLSKQGSYSRRSPDSQALQHLERARYLLMQISQNNDKSPDAYNLLSRVEECLLNYKDAILYLEKSFAAGKIKTRKDLKRLASLRNNLVEWRDLSITPNQLTALGEYLRSAEITPDNQDYTYTREWMTCNGFEDREIDSILSAMKRRGAYSDYQVLANIVHG